MKNQYFGDVNDYRKYGLLRALGAVTQLPIGVCWLLTADDGRTDGEFRRYLEEPDRWRSYDAELYDHLRCLLVPGTSRSVSHARSRDLIPGATYYEALLPDDTPSRDKYFEGAWATLEECPIIFFDPDNGIEIPSKPIGTKDSAKYVYWQEIERAYEAGHSLVIYQHFPRSPRDAYTARLAEQFAARLGAPLVDSFRTSHVVFFLVARPEHAGTFKRAHDDIHRRWGGQIIASAHVSDSSGDTSPSQAPSLSSSGAEPRHMDIGAELTLRLARLVQEYHSPRSSLAGWFFLPDFRYVTWAEAREILAAAPKPLIVAPLVEPGHIAIWDIGRIEPDQRARAEHHMVNQLEYFTEKLRLGGLRETDTLCLQNPAGEFTLSVTDFLKWVREYGVSGVTIDKSSGPCAGRLIVRRPGGGQPLGMA